MMEKTHYLPDEELNFRNYPEVGQQWDSIKNLMQYSMQVHKAVVSYNDGTYDKVNISETDIQGNIALCRSTLEVLGNAPKVCFDVVRELRELQYNMQELLYAKKRFGSKYVGTPAVTKEVGL